MTHGRRIALVIGALAAYFIGFGFIFGWHRLAADWWPLDTSPDGPNLYVSFVWVPLAAVLAWAWADAQHAAHKAELTELHRQHLAEVDARHEKHLIRALELGSGKTDLTDATPGDRSIPSEDHR